MSEIQFISLPVLNSYQNIEMVQFLDKILAHRVNEKIWDWEFNTLPDTVFTVAKQNSKIAGIHSMLPVTLSIDGRLINSTKSETGYVDKNFRGKQLYEKLFSFAIEKVKENGCKITWGFTPAVKAFRENLKCIVREDIIYLAKIHIKYQHFFRNKNKSRNLFFAIGKYLVYNLYTLKNKIITGFYLSYDKSITEKENALNKMDLQILYSKINEQYKNLLYIHLDADYLDWRVNKNPSLSYKKIFFYKNDLLAGYIIYSVTDEVLVVADFTYDGDMAVLLHMLKHLLSLNGNYYSLQYWGNFKCALNNSVFKMLEKIGAKCYRDKNRNLIYKIFSSDLDNEKINNISNWYITGLWTEGFNI